MGKRPNAQRGMTDPQSRRIDGWKSIAAYFGRERTTVIRWAAERGLPVHRIPGSSRGSVYAIAGELDAWLAASREGVVEAGAGGNAPALPAPRRPRIVLSRLASKRGALMVIAIAALGLGLGVYALETARAPTAAALMPRDADTAALYVEARADWARRTPGSIAAAIDKLKRVVAIEPRYAPAHAALADCYLLAREFGALTDLEAFGRAQAAVDTALRIDPEHAGALRARGFIAYWWLGDRLAAARDFRRSLAINDRYAQTHFWFANTLIDNGDFDAGMHHFAEAQLIEPASAAIAADLAWARWSVGDRARGKTELLELRRSNPALATVPDYLSVMALAEGSVEGFVGEIETMAAQREIAALTEQARQLRAAMVAAGPSAVAAMVVREAEDEVENGVRRTLAWPAFVASAIGARAELARLLRKADARGETWGSAGLRSHMTERWRGDGEIGRLLERRRPPPLAARASGARQ